METEFRREHPKNALSPMVSTLSGIVTEMIPEQFLNAQQPMRVTPPFIEMDLTFAHPSNAESPIRTVL